MRASKSSKLFALFALAALAQLGLLLSRSLISIFNHFHHKSYGTTMSLWTRALQARSTCKCPSCLPMRGAVVRRATTTTPRQFKFGEVLTVFYTSVLATAAVLDTSWKDVQRKELDRAISEAQTEVKMAEENQRQRLLALGIPFSHQSEPTLQEDEMKLSLEKLFGQPNTNETTGIDHLTAGLSMSSAIEEMASRSRLSMLCSPARIPNDMKSEILAGLKDMVQAGFEGSSQGIREAGTQQPTVDHGPTIVDDSKVSAIKDSKFSVAIEGSPTVEVIVEEFAVEEIGTQAKTQIESSSRQDDPRSFTKIGRVERKRVIKFLRTLDRNMNRADGSRSMLNTQQKGYRTALAARAAKLREETAIAKFALSLFLFRAEQEHTCLEGAKKRTNVEYRKSLSGKEIELDSRLHQLISMSPLQANKFETLGHPNYLSGSHEIVDLVHVLATFDERMTHSDALRDFARMLLSSSSLPDLEDFNDMIAVFCDLDLVKPAWFAIEAMFNSGLRANERTVTVLLAFYTKTYDFRGFLQLAEHLEGPLPLDLRVEREALKLDSLEWTAFKSGTFKASWTSRLAQAAPFHRVAASQSSRSSCRGGQIYEALISGWLRFGCIKQAWMEYKRMRCNGYPALSSKTQGKLRRTLRKLAAKASGPELPAMKLVRDSSQETLDIWRQEWREACGGQSDPFYDLYHKRKAGRSFEIAKRNIDQRYCPLRKPHIRNSQKPLLIWDELPFVAEKFGVPWPQRAGLSKSLSQLQDTVDSDVP